MKRSNTRTARERRGRLERSDPQRFLAEAERIRRANRRRLGRMVLTGS